MKNIEDKSSLKKNHKAESKHYNGKGINYTYNY